MGVHAVSGDQGGEKHRLFMKRVLNDLKALEVMLATDSMFATGTRRIGAEQEIFLVDDAGRPTPRAMEILKVLDDPNFTTELGLFNLEMNGDPRVWGGRCLSDLHEDLIAGLAKAREAARGLNSEIVLAGILPTLRKSDLGLENMVPLPRYQALNEAFCRLRGGPYELKLVGVDELYVKHDNVMLESCNTSFQIHFQATPAEFPRLYNVAQVVTAPVLAAATNSPLLFGRRLWRETRLALFEQSVDTRSSRDHFRETPSRVSFGRDWLRNSVVEIYKEDISRFRALVGIDDCEDPFEALRRGDAPQLQALRLHNGTVYRWNRACYGITDGVPHLRIENRVLPAGPTVLDEVANAAFFFGLMSAVMEEVPDITAVIEFEDAKGNFIAAARQGLAAQFTWFGGETLPASELIRERLLPLARKGLEAGGIDAEDAEEYLGVIEARVASGRTGSDWQLKSLAGMKRHGVLGERLGALTRAMITRQASDRPVHEWEPATFEEGAGWKRHYTRVEQIMLTDLFTVQEDEPVSLVAHMMDWARIRHVIVEDTDHRLVGLVSYRAVMRALGEGGDSDERPVSEIMRADLISISPETQTLSAIELMRKNRIACLPVTKDGRLLGVVTEAEFMGIAAELLSQKLSE